ncbi:hypothetical protein [Thermogemmatispora tikiterensis]|uniref:Uncharacterized protein n=1 Tax=Thermogemmatispora tikiterensis TaxID=1825093 RepID=A0A328VFY7_9CHLR|nr:hypothetical protein [Thermogemmatispora tikiterensis]RAQ95869.1 hypothetical protein A4R35_10000 [Thermogemmatispora tikiterensis]
MLTDSERDVDSLRLLRFSAPLALELDRERCQRLASLIHRPLREEDFLLLEALFQEREQRPRNCRRLLSERTYELLSLMAGRLIHEQPVAARTALEWGLFRLIPREEDA